MSRTEFADDTTAQRSMASRLYHLPPIGIGTRDVESMTSYVMRLAEAHTVPVGVLLREEILPRFGRSYILKNGQGWTRFWRDNVYRVNGVSAWTSDWLEVVHALTLREDLRPLTMLAWREVLSPRDLLRSHRSWCPTCFEEQRASGKIVYEPLMWSLLLIKVCPKHNRPLVEACPYDDCRRTQTALAAHSRAGFCADCGRWLGRDTSGYSAMTLDPCYAEARKPDDCRDIQAIAELLAGAATIGVEADGARIAVAVNQLVDGLGGSVRLSARTLDLTPRSVNALRQGEQIPRLSLLLSLAFKMGTTPLKLCTEPLIPRISTQSTSASSMAWKPKRRPRKLDWQAIERDLLEMFADDKEPPCSLTAAADRLNLDQSQLARKLPHLCRAIRVRYAEYQQARVDENRRTTLKKLRSVIRKISDEGNYPGIIRVEEAMGRPRLLQSPELLHEWRAMVEDLGWEIRH